MTMICFNRRRGRTAPASSKDISATRQTAAMRTLLKTWGNHLDLAASGATIICGEATR
jgi:hypothetical protein